MLDITIELAGETLVLMPERAMFWPRKRTLVIADVHFGKAAAFRAAKIPVPPGTTADTLARLDRAVTRMCAERLVVLGDLLHAPTGQEPRTVWAVAEWREKHPRMEIELVRGNHDWKAGDPPKEWRVELFSQPYLNPPFAWRHEPPSYIYYDEGYTFAGHMHPGFIVKGRGDSVRLPCFYLGPTQGILPAFGEFTGMGYYGEGGDVHVYVVADDEVIQVQ